MEPTLPDSPFGSFFFFVVSVRIIFNLTLLLLQLLFLKGAWTFTGWNSNFSWTLLIAVALSAALNLFFESLAILCSAFSVSWTDYQWLWRTLGNFTMFPMSLTIVLTMLMTIHRFIYTCFPLKADSIAPPIVTKSLFYLIIAGHIATFFLLFTELGTFRYIPVFLTSSVKSNTTLTEVLYKLSCYSDWIIILNPLVYILILFVMYFNKSYKIAKKTEIRMTLQTLCTCLLEFICFIEWIVFSPDKDSSWSIHLFKSLTMSLYLGGGSIIYLIFNKLVLTTKQTESTGG